MSFDLQPILKGELLLLRPLRPEDFDDLYAVASDPLIWEQHPVKDHYKEEVFKEFFREALESGGALIAIDSLDGRVIGSSRFWGYDKEKSAIEIGWTFLAKSHWGGIYNREMKHLMLRHAFKFVHSVVFLVGPQNWRSRRAMEKIGGVLVGVAATVLSTGSLLQPDCLFPGSTFSRNKDAGPLTYASQQDSDVAGNRAVGESAKGGEQVGAARVMSEPVSANARR
jgi:RimJ/RimL family protein N-acetyltransferase